MRAINAVVLHTAGAYDFRAGKVVHQSKEQIDAYHREHYGWIKIGYHWMVEEDGRGSQGRPDTDVGAHAGGFNQFSLGLCVSGHGDYEKWNDKQMTEVIRRVTSWCRTYHLEAEDVMGHRETGHFGGPPVFKTCPGKLIDMDAIRTMVHVRLMTAG